MKTKRNHTSVVRHSKAVELAEMKEMLWHAGYNPAYATLLQREGMGPYELEDRLRIMPDTVGSLGWTHGYRKTRFSGEQTMEQNPMAMGQSEKIAIAVGLTAGVAALVYYLTRPAATVVPAGGSITVTGQAVPPITLPPVVIPTGTTTT